MGSTTHHSEDGDIPDADYIIQITRKPKKAPEYKPRSRKPEDLPGGIRVPIISKPDSLVKPRLDAGREGLEELKALREAHQRIISDVTYSYCKEHEQVSLYLFEYIDIFVLYIKLTYSLLKQIYYS